LAIRDELNGDTITGILPLILFCAPGCVRRLLSLPYTDFAGVLADSGSATGALLDAAWEIAVQEGAEHLELRQSGFSSRGFSRHLAGYGDYTPHSFKVGLSRSLPGHSEILWHELSGKVRNQIRKAQKNNYSTKIGSSVLLDDFYAVFSENMRDLGSPVHAPQLFSEMSEQLQSNMHIVVVYNGTEPIAAAVLFRCQNILYNPWASSLRRFRPSCPNMLLYWTMLSLGCELGCSRFDFGRSSPGAPTCRFKQQWGAEMLPLVWHVVSTGNDSWHPGNESLLYENVQQLSLQESQKRGPVLRRWISL
jgi:CelD/BcsL family acetyltransferase involved in cellulose biosynthesis